MQNKCIKIFCKFAAQIVMGVRQTMIKYLKWVLPVIFIAYYGSITFFMHVHIEHGTTIVHSHPFSAKAGGANHHHASLSEIQLFHALTTIHVGDGAVHALHLHFLSQQIAEIVEFPVYSGYATPCKGQLYLRAPPVI